MEQEKKNQQTEVLREKEPRKLPKLTHILTVFALASLMCVSCFAADGDTSTVTSMLTNAGTFGATAISTVWTLMTANAYLELLLGMALVSVAFRLFAKAKRAARH